MLLKEEPEDGWSIQKVPCLSDLNSEESIGECNSFLIYQKFNVDFAELSAEKRSNLSKNRPHCMMTRVFFSKKFERDALIDH